MKVLITGGTGFLGRQLAHTLQRYGDEVTVSGRNAAIGAQLEAVGLRFVQADLRDEAAIASLCANQDCVLHCGAFSSPWGKAKTFYEINVLGTRHIAQGCLTHGVQRLIHVSTSAVYFTYAHQYQIPESQPFAPPVNAYARTKQLAEQEIAKAHQQGLSTIIIRPRGIFGPGDTALLPRLLKASDRTGIPLIREGKAIVDITYVDNVITALRCAQQAPNTLSGQVYNITNGEPKPLIELLQAVSEQLGCELKFKPLPFPVAYGLAAAMEGAAKLFSLSEPPLTRYTVGLMAFSQTLAIEAAIAELGYRPQVTLEAGIAQFSHWWKRQNDIY